MFKKVFSLLFLLSIVSSSWGQALPAKRNDSCTTTINTTNGGPAYSCVTNKGSGFQTLLAGTAIVGKVGIDQTTPGTTNGVQLVTHALVWEGGTIAFGSLTSSFANVIANGSAHAYLLCTFTNATNQAIAWDNGTTVIVQYQGASSFQIRDFGSDSGVVNTAIRAKYLVAPTSGAVYADCGY